jgi:CPA1 family monovalent cation:H+ antiporter
VEHGLIIAICAVAVIAGSNLLAARVPVPAAIVQTAIGIVLAFVPGFPTIHLQPDFVLMAVLPLLVYASAVELPWEDFRDNLRSIATLAFGLVAVTVVAVAAIAHAVIPALPWAAALVLGAIVSPTDPVASSAVAARIGVPQRLVAIIEGEGLVNDAVALTIKAIAVGALVGGSLSISAGIVKFAAIVVGEVAYGWALGWVMAVIRKRITDSSAEILVSLITPFAAYLPPLAFGGSGVLATVATGMYIGEQNPELVPPGTRLHLTSVWQLVVYTLNGALFLLTGLQFRSIWNGTTSGIEHPLLYGFIVAAVCIVLRFVWTWPGEWLPRALRSGARRRDPMPPSRHLAFIAWSGMRGAISLAAALSIAESVSSRALIVFITACVIAATLLVQGSTLPWIIRWLRLDQDAAAERERESQREAEARSAAAAAAVEALDRERHPIADELRRSYESIPNSDGAEAASDPDLEARFRRKAIDAARRRIIAMHHNGEISDAVLRRIERDLDLREALLENRVPRPE